MGGCHCKRTAAVLEAETTDQKSPRQGASAPARGNSTGSVRSGRQEHDASGRTTPQRQNTTDSRAEDEIQKVTMRADTDHMSFAKIMARLSTEAGVEEDGAPKAVGEEALKGLNGMLQVMWPYARQAISRRARKEMLERAAVESEKWTEFKLLELEVEIDVGDEPPTLTGMRAYTKRKHSESDFEGIQFDIDFHWKTNNFKMQPKMQVAGPLLGDFNVEEISMTDLEVGTTGSVLLAPLINEEPCFGGAQVFFPNLPDVDLKLDGFKGMWQGGMVRKVLLKVIRKMTVALLTDSLVLPNRRLVKARPDVALETLMSIKSPVPIGLLEVEVVEARDLLPMDILHRHSDPYVTVRLGDSTIRTSTVHNTVTPKWDDGPNYLPVYNLAQIVEVAVMHKATFKEELLGHMQFFTAWSFWKALNLDSDGKSGENWFRLEARRSKSDMKVVKAGELKLRVRFLVSDGKVGNEESEFARVSSKSREQKAPSLLTVKLLGLEGEAAAAMKGAVCQVSLQPREDEAGGLGHKIGEKLHLFHSKRKHHTHGSMTGWGATTARPGMPSSITTGKAKTWAEDHSIQSSLQLSPETVRAIEQLRYRENWENDKIARMFGISEQTVQSAAELRPSFDAVWHEALHFVQYPDEPLLDGTITITVKLPKGPPTKAMLDVNHEAGRIRDRQRLLSSAIAPNGEVGEVRLNMSTEPIKPDTRWSRRVRARLRRHDQRPSAQDPLAGDQQCDPSVGNPVPGCLIEFMVEVRPLVPGDPADSIEHGQAVVGVCTAFADEDALASQANNWVQQVTGP